jgi:hypothetical protein
LLENSVKRMEVTSDAGVGPTFRQVRTVLLEEIIPAMTDLWDLYMIATEGPGKVLKPGSGQAPGNYLWSQLKAGGRSAGVSSSKSNGLTIEQCIVGLEQDLHHNRVAGAPAIPSIFGEGKWSRRLPWAWDSKVLALSHQNKAWTALPWRSPDWRPK